MSLLKFLLVFERYIIKIKFSIIYSEYVSTPFYIYEIVKLVDGEVETILFRWMTERLMHIYLHFVLPSNLQQ